MEISGQVYVHTLVHIHIQQVSWLLGIFLTILGGKRNHALIIIFDKFLRTSREILNNGFETIKVIWSVCINVYKV